MNEEEAIRFLLDRNYKVVKREAKGRPAAPRKCRKCGMWCATAREAQAHCAKKRTGAKQEDYSDQLAKEETPFGTFATVKGWEKEK